MRTGRGPAKSRPCRRRRSDRCLPPGVSRRERTVGGYHPGVQSCYRRDPPLHRSRGSERSDGRDLQVQRESPATGKTPDCRGPGRGKSHREDQTARAALWQAAASRRQSFLAWTRGRRPALNTQGRADEALRGRGLDLGRHGAARQLLSPAAGQAVQQRPEGAKALYSTSARKRARSCGPYDPPTSCWT